jgi:hypothetical protein
LIVTISRRLRRDRINHRKLSSSADEGAREEKMEFEKRIVTEFSEGQPTTIICAMADSAIA